MKKKIIIEKCPNCKNPDKQIPLMPNGCCGVCGGSGKIEWQKICALEDLKKYYKINKLSTS